MRSSLFGHVTRRTLVFADVSGQPLGPISSRIKHNCQSMQRNMPEERTSGSNFANNNRRTSGCRVSGVGVWKTDRLSTPLTWMLSGGDITASDCGHFAPLERNAGRS
jgi:hypothetical protein